MLIKSLLDLLPTNQPVTEGGKFAQLALRDEDKTLSLDLTRAGVPDIVKAVLHALVVEAYESESEDVDALNKMPYGDGEGDETLQVQARELLGKTETLIEQFKEALDEVSHDEINRVIGQLFPALDHQLPPDGQTQEPGSTSADEATDGQ